MTNVISMNLDPEALAHRATKRFEDQWVNVTELGDGGPTWNDIEENVPWGADLDAPLNDLVDRATAWLDARGLVRGTDYEVDGALIGIKDDFTNWMFFEIFVNDSDEASAEDWAHRMITPKASA